MSGTDGLPTAGGGRDDPVVPVYIVHWEAPDHCARSVASIQQSVGVRPLVHVVENSGDGGDELRARLPEAVPILVPGVNTGFAGGANIALEHWLTERGEAPLAVVASHDLSVDRHALSALVRLMRTHPDLGVIGPSFERLHPRGVWNGRRARLLPAVADDELIEADWILGACLMIRRTAIEGAGGFESRLGSYMEDVEFCLRLRDHGWNVAAARDASAAEAGSTSDRVTVLVDRNTMYVAVKRGGLAGLVPPALLLCWFVVRGVVAAAFARNRSADRRRQSLRHSADHLRALGAVASRPSRLMSFVREPGVGPRLRTANTPNGHARRDDGQVAAPDRSTSPP
jgi:N-acetylglucosaminyl-diphospho-decaprenol L-rhamnosyltransferase